VKDPFPCCKTAQLVESKEEIILNPLESAIEDVNLRTEKINSLLAHRPVSRKTLTGLLQGCVAPQVHGGAVQVCHAFLKLNEDRNSKQYGLKMLANLKEALRRFLRACQQGLDLNAKELGDRDDEFQQHLAKSFDEMCTLIRPHIHDASNSKLKHRGTGGKRVHFGSSMSEDFNVQLLKHV